MVSLEETVKRLKKKSENLVGDPATIALARLYALEEVADAAHEVGSRPECEKVHDHVLKACIFLLRDGAGIGVTSSIRRVLSTLWGWLDHNAIVNGHKEIVLVIDSTNNKHKKFPQLLTACLDILCAAYDATIEQGVEGIIGSVLLHSFTSLPALHKMTDSTSKIQCMVSLSKCLIATVASGSPTVPLKEESKAIKQCQRAIRDKDISVRDAGYRCISEASRCVIATGAATPAYDLLLNTSIKGLEERSYSVRRSAATAVASLLFTAFEQHQEEASYGKQESGKRVFGIGGRKKRTLGGTVLGLKFLRELFTNNPSVREGASMAAGLFLERCGAAVAANAQDLFNYLLSFCEKINNTNESESLHACRLIAATVSLWLGGCPSESVLVTVLREITEKLSSSSATPNKKQICLLVLPDLTMQLGSDAVQQSFDGIFEALQSCASVANLRSISKIRVDAAHALRLMLDLVPSKLPTTCHLLVSSLIGKSGNALCSVGTPCDHEALRSMMCCATLLLAIFPREYCHVVPSSVQRQLTELCDVAFPTELNFECGSPTSPTSVPLDPLQKFELSCLLEACLACSSGFGGLKASLPKVTAKIAFVLHGKEVPTTQKSIVIALRSRASVLQCLVSVIKFAKLSGKDISILTKLINQGIVSGLEDTLEILFHKSLPQSNAQVDLLLCKTRTLAYEAISILPQLPKSVNLYNAVMKTCVGTLTALSIQGVVNTLAASSLQDAMKLSGIRLHEGFITGDAYQYNPNLENTVSQDTDWHHVLCNSGSLSFQATQSDLLDDQLLSSESIRLPAVVELLNMSIRALVVVFSRQGKGNKAVVIAKLKTQLQATCTKKSNFKKDAPLQVNILLAIVMSLRCCMQHPNCRSVLWNTDEDLSKAGSDCIALAQLVFNSTCPLIRTVAGDIIGLATALTGSTPSPIDAFLPTILPKSTLNESLSIAHTVGALHGYDPKGRLDVVSLSISYLQNIWKSKCGAPQTDNNSYLPEPIVLSVLSRIIQSCGISVAQYAETVLWFAIDVLVSSTIDTDYRILLGACGVARAVIQSLGKNLSPASPVCAMIRAILSHGVRSEHPAVQSYCLSTLYHAIRSGFESRLRLDLSHYTSHAIGVLNNSFIASSEHLSRGHMISLVKLVYVCCKAKPSVLAETVGPRHILKLIDAVGSRQNLTSLLYSAGTHILTDTVETKLRCCEQPERERAKYRLVEWLSECEQLILMKADKRPQPSQQVIVDSDDEESSPSSSISPTSSPKSLIVPRVSTKSTAVNFIVFVLQLIENDVSGDAELQKWIAPRYESLLRCCSIASDDISCSSFRSIGLKGLRCLVRIFKIVPDLSLEDEDDNDVDPAVKLTHRSVLAINETQLSSAARQGLDPANTGEVRCAAAMLASELVVCCLLPRPSVSRLLPHVSKWFSDTSDSLANLGSVAAMCRVVRFAEDLSEERRLQGVIVPTELSIPDAIFAVVKEGNITSEMINTAAVTHLRYYGLLCGLLDGWVLPVSRKDLLPKLQHSDIKDLVPYFMGMACRDLSNADLVCATAASLIEGFGNRKVHTKEGYFLSLQYLQKGLSIADPQQCVALGTALGHLLRERFNKTEDIEEKSALLECLSATQSAAKVAESSEKLQSIALSTKNIAALKSVLKCRLQISVGNVSWIALVFHSIVTILTESDLNSQLEKDVKNVGWDALSQISSTPSKNSPQILNAFVQGMLSLKGTSATSLEGFWFLTCSTVCIYKKISGEWDSKLDDIIGDTLLSLEVRSINNLVTTLKQLRSHVNIIGNAGLKQLLLVSLTAGSAAVCSPAVTAEIVIPIAKLVSLSTFLLKEFSEDVEFSSILVVAISSLSTASDRNHSLSSICNKCLYELVQKFSSHFRDLVPQLNPSVVQLMRRQIESQVRQTPQVRQQSAPVGVKLTINADAFS